MLEQIPNIGPSLANDLRQLGVATPAQLAERDAFELYVALCRHTGQRQDPCVLDSFMAGVDFMHGAASTPWWHYTAQRKALHGPWPWATVHGLCGATERRVSPEANAMHL